MFIERLRRLWGLFSLDRCHCEAIRSVRRKLFNDVRGSLCFGNHLVVTTYLIAHAGFRNSIPRKFHFPLLHLCSEACWRSECRFFIRFFSLHKRDVVEEDIAIIVCRRGIIFQFKSYSCFVNSCRSSKRNDFLLPGICETFNFLICESVFSYDCISLVPIYDSDNIWLLCLAFVPIGQLIFTLPINLDTIQIKVFVTRIKWMTIRI